MKNFQGFTLVEMLTVILLVGILAAIAAPIATFGNKAAQNAVFQVSGNFKLIRAKAMATTSAYRIRPNSATDLLAESANNCSAPATSWTASPEFDLDLPKNVQMVAPTTLNGATPSTPTSWKICFDARGMADSSLTITLKDITASPSTPTKTVQVLVGGAVVATP